MALKRKFAIETSSRPIKKTSKTKERSKKESTALSKIVTSPESASVTDDEFRDTDMDDQNESLSTDEEQDSDSDTDELDNQSEVSESHSPTTSNSNGASTGTHLHILPSLTHE